MRFSLTGIFLIFQDLISQDPGKGEIVKNCLLPLSFIVHGFMAGQVNPRYQHVTGVCMIKKSILKKVGPGPNFS